MLDTKQLKYTKKEDLLGLTEDAPVIDFSAFIGSWINTKKDSGLIVKVDFEDIDGGLYMNAYGSCEPELCDWGKARCRVFADKVYTTKAGAFKAKYEFDFMEVEIAANVKLGVLVLQSYSTFTDGSRRSNYYNREFYAPAG